MLLRRPSSSFPALRQLVRHLSRPSRAQFKSRKLRNLPADDPAGEIVNEEMLSSMKQVLAQLMFEDEALAELISVAISASTRHSQAMFLLLTS